ILILLLILLIIGITAHFKLKNYVLQDTKSRLSESLLLAKNIIENKKLNPLLICKLQLGEFKTRYTLLSYDGHVLCDSARSDISYINPIENHNDRPEIINAKNNKESFNIHYSKTLSMEMLYRAVLIKDLQHISNFDLLIIRMAIPFSEIESTIHRLDKEIFSILLPALFFITLFSIWMSIRPFYSLRSVIQKIYQINQSIFNTVSNTTFQFFELNRNINHTTSVPQKKRRWPIIEKILEEAQHNIEKTLDELHLENSKLNAIMESTQAGIVAVNKKGFIWFSNKKFQDLFVKIEDRGTLINFSSYLYHLPLHINHVFDDLNIKYLFEKSLEHENENVEENSILQSHNIQLQTINESKEFFDITVNHLRDSKGVLLGSVGVFYNVTERKRLEQMKLDFVSNISHEVRTPLSAIQGYIQLIKSDLNCNANFAENNLQSSEQFNGHLEKVDKNIKRLLNLFDDLLKLSTIETKQDLKKENISNDELNELCESVIATLTPIYESKNTSINFEISENGLFCDINLLEHVIINLIDNAFKYTQNNGTINVKIYDSDKDSYFNNHTILEVSDNGIGISIENQNRIFERFYRVDTSHSREMGGTGLGLSIVKHIIQKHSGHIELISDLNRGSTFKIYFPN
ncbi:MAG: hypothetical protein HQK51_12750, partial [Oligoflexia bacterium]|nr:hypothetical protein [Oligoflexia bacterium]